jgi:hypothetical protein
MLATFEEYAFYAAAFLVLVLFLVTFRRPGMTPVAQTGLSLGCSVLLVCANFADRAQDLNDQIYLLAIAAEVLMLCYQVWKKANRPPAAPVSAL